MKKRGFATIYALLLLLLLSISIAFAYNQAENDQEFNTDLYNKKRAVYKAESVLNLFLEDEEKIKESLEIVRRVNRENYRGDKYSIFYDFEGVRQEIFLTYSKNLQRFTLTSKQYFGDSMATAEAVFKDPASNEDIIYHKFKDFPVKLLTRSYDFIEGKGLTDQDLSKEILGIKGDFLVSDKNEKIKKNDFKGLLLVDGDLVLEKDFSLEGLLVIRGDIISKNGKKLNLKGQIISEKNISKKNLSYTFDKEFSEKYIKELDDFYKLELLFKRVY